MKYIIEQNNTYKKWWWINYKHSGGRNFHTTAHFERHFWLLWKLIYKCVEPRRAILLYRHVASQCWKFEKLHRHPVFNAHFLLIYDFNAFSIAYVTVTDTIVFFMLQTIVQWYYHCDLFRFLKKIRKSKVLIDEISGTFSYPTPPRPNSYIFFLVHIYKNIYHIYTYLSRNNSKLSMNNLQIISKTLLFKTTK